MVTNIGEKIAALRKKNGMTQETLAAEIGVTAQSVSKWENGTNMPDVMLLPVIADIFSVSIDELFGRSKKFELKENVEIFEDCCEAVLDTIGLDMYNMSLVNLDMDIAQQIKDADEYIDKYKSALKYAYDSKLRTGIMSKEGLAYYRHTFGGVLLRCPKEKWSSLFEDEAAIKIVALIADSDFRAAIAELLRSEKTVFTASALCSKCGIENVAALEEKLTQSGMFVVKKVDIDGKEVAIYEMMNPDRMFLWFAILMSAKEYAEYQGMYYGYSGTSDYIYG